ncbi:MAG: type II toxin-antitoxin system VapC family toxin [Candidatus Thermoplasmatota archaeon]
MPIEDPEPFVVDASAITKLFLDEPESVAFRTWYGDRAVAGSRMHSPELLGYEVANVLAKSRPEWAPQDFSKALQAALGGIELSRSFLAVGAFLPDASAYDANYLAVARSTNAALVTYDRDLVRAAARHGIRVHIPR